MTPGLTEYLRRNNLHAASVGVYATAVAALNRVNKLRNPPKWLVDHLEAIVDRAFRVENEMAIHRDEMAKHRDDLSLNRPIG